MLTKEELLFVAEKAETYRNPKTFQWVLQSCPIEEEGKRSIQYVAKLSKQMLREYG